MAEEKCEQIKTYIPSVMPGTEEGVSEHKAEALWLSELSDSLSAVGAGRHRSASIGSKWLRHPGAGPPLQSSYVCSSGPKKSVGLKHAFKGQSVW